MQSTIHDLFKTESVLEEDSKKRLQQLGFNMREQPQITAVMGTTTKTPEEEAVATGEATQILENALLAAEDEMDAKAARNVRAEADAELAEFDETIDLDELDGGGRGVHYEGVKEKKSEIDEIFDQVRAEKTR